MENKKLNNILKEIKKEFDFAISKFGAFNNAHEGYAVLLEEVDELWENVKLKQGDPYRTPSIIQEAIHVATMSIRLIYDCGGMK